MKGRGLRGCCDNSTKANFYAPSIPAGEFRQRITIQTPTLIQDDIGGGVYQWDDLKTVWARIQTASVGETNRNILSSRYNERFQQAQTREIQFFNVTMRYDSDITTDMRFTYNNRVFQIEAIINQDEFNMVQTLSCREGG